MLQTLLHVTEQWELSEAFQCSGPDLGTLQALEGRTRCLLGPCHWILPREWLYCPNPSASSSRACRLHLSSAPLRSCAESYHFSLGNWDVQCLSQQQPDPEIWSGDITQLHLLLSLGFISLWNNSCIPSLSAWYGGRAAQWDRTVIGCAQSGHEQPPGLLSFWLQMSHYNIISNANKPINFCQ